MKAFSQLQSVKKMTPSDPNAPILMFYAAENLLMAVFTSENCDYGAASRKHGSHQLDGMLDELPNDCKIKSKFEGIVTLVAYATTYRYPTPAGRIQEPPGKEEAEGYYTALIEILNMCTTHFKVDVRLEQPEAGSVSPMR